MFDLFNTVPERFLVASSIFTLFNPLFRSTKEKEAVLNLLIFLQEKFSIWKLSIKIWQHKVNLTKLFFFKFYKRKCYVSNILVIISAISKRFGLGNNDKKRQQQQQTEYVFLEKKQPILLMCESTCRSISHFKTLAFWNALNLRYGGNICKEGNEN